MSNPAGSTEVRSPVAGDATQSLIVERVTHAAPEVVILELADAAGGNLPLWQPGAHIDLKLPSGKVRQYSLCGDPEDRRRYRVAVLREAAGRGGSEEIHAVAAPGLMLPVLGPRNHFPLVEAPDFLFLAGGIGITPLLPMIRHVARAGHPWRLVYGGRRREAMAFLDEVAACEGGEVEVVAQDESGHPDIGGLIAALGPDTVVYGCGPSPMLAALEAAADRQGCTSRLHIERFSAAAEAVAPSTEAGDVPFEVELRQSGLVLQVPADRTLGSVLEEAGVPVPFSCQEGYCGSCETRVLDGVPDHRDTILTDDEKAAATAMFVCVGRARTPRLVLDL